MKYVRQGWHRNSSDDTSERYFCNRRVEPCQKPSGMLTGLISSWKLRRKCLSLYIKIYERAFERHCPAGN